MWLRFVNFINTVLGTGASVLTMWELFSRLTTNSSGDLIYASAIVLVTVFFSSLILHLVEIRGLKKRIDNFLTFKAVDVQEREGRLYILITGYDIHMLEPNTLIHIYEKQGEKLIPVGLARTRYIYRDSKLAELSILQLYKELPEVRKLIVKVALGGLAWKLES